MDPSRWLANFSSSETEHATALLNAFVFICQPLMDEMMAAAFQDLSRALRDLSESFVATQAKWRAFFDSMIITCVRGEDPNPTDSGFRFLRMARQVLGIPETRILLPEQALEHLLSGASGTVVFVDDFVGSGDQFIKTWKRKITFPSQQTISFEQVNSASRHAQLIYCPLVCTHYGLNNIAQMCPRVRMHPAHVLPNDYGAFASDSVIWPPALAPSAEAFIESASKRAGIPQYLWRGYHDLGLAMGFEHSIPDATLPLFYWNQNGWNPLIERT
jgi:hypothetical protein